MDPRTRLALLGCVGLLAVCLDRPASLAVLCGLCLVPLLLLRISAEWWRRGSLAVVAVVWGTVLSQGLFYRDLPRLPLVELGPLVLWKQGVFWGLVQSLRFVAAILAGIAVAVSTPPDRLHAALLRLRVPFALSFLATTALRTVPDTGRTFMTVRAARRERGRPAWRRSPWAWLRLELAMLRPVVAEALRRARSLAEALDTRGFDPAAPRGVARPLRLRAWEWPLLTAALLGTGAVVTARVLFVLYSSEVLYLGPLRPLYGFVRQWL